jgi:hypothetical protein
VELAFREAGDTCLFRIRGAGTDVVWERFQSIQAGLSFLFGCRIRVRGWQLVVGPAIESVLLGERPRASKRVYPPLDNMLWLVRGPARFEEVVALAAEFFMTQLGDSIRAGLEILWDAADMSMDSRLLVAATVLEGVVRKVNTGGRPLPLKDDILAHLRTLTSERPVLDRWTGLLNGAENLHVPTILARWVEERRYQARSEELRAFKSRRNPLAHGHLLPTSGGSGASQDMGHLSNLINKIVLTHMGYRGPFADYGQARDYSKCFPIIV